MEPEAILVELFVIFVAAKLAGEVFERIGQPPVIGELLAGIVLGGHALGVIGDTEVHHVLQELGAIILLFMVGLDTPPEELRGVGGRVFAVGAMGIVLPFLTGAGLIYAVEGSVNEALFLGTAMVATSVGITARVLADLGVIRALESRIILGAGVVDDVLGLLVLAFVTGVTRGELSPLTIVTIAAAAVGFVALVGLYGTRVVHAAAPRIDAARISRVELAAALGVCLGLSALASAIGLAAIIGAFLAGMAFSEIGPRWQLEKQMDPVYQFFVPFFFVITGARVDVGLLVQPETLWLVVAVTALAIAGKLIGCGGAAYGMGWRSMSIIGVGMVPRGEVGIIVATVALSTGVIEQQLYGVVVAMSVLTTLIAPPFLKMLFAPRRREEARVTAERTDEVEGIGG